MHFAIICIDKPGSGEIRKNARPAHLEHLEKHRPQILVTGPMLAEDGETPNGSLLILDFADMAAAKAFAAGDPYAQAGLFESVTIKQWRKVFP
ncbi:MAG: YciI family protein [Alphaproteobacteria bacterium]